MWHPFDFHGEPIGCVRAVAVPTPLIHHRHVLVWADNGLFNVWYYRTASVNKVASAADAEVLFNPATGILTLQRNQNRMHGACGPLGEMYTTPAVTEHPSGERLEPDPDTDSLHILDAAGNVRQTIPNFRVSSEPWAFATLVNDLSVLVVADPHSVRLFKYVVEKGGETPRWKAAGGETEQKQLYRAVLNHPDEDTPRLMYADWLDENGDPARAEFIRLQCRLTERQSAAPVPHIDPDQQRATVLGDQMKARWLAELPPIHGVHWVGFRRGFPAVHVTSPTTLVRAAKRVWAAAPVEAVTIDGLQAKGAALFAASPCVRRIRHISLERYYIRRDGEAPLRALFHAAGLSGLRSLTVTSSYLDDAGMGVLATSPYLTNLEWLTTNYQGVTDASAAALLASPALGKLKGGPFRGSSLSPEVREKLKARFPFA